MAGGFRLQTLLDLHATHELAAQVAWAAALREVDQAEALLQRMYLAIPAEEQQVKTWQQGALSVVLVQAGLHRLECMRSAVMQQTAVVQQRRTHAEMRRQALVDIATHRRAIEKLRDKAAAEQLREERRKDMAALDEASTLRLQRQSS